MLQRMLPKWVTENRTAVLEEAAPYRNLSSIEREEIIRKVMRVGARQLASRADRERLLAWSDPLPKSSVEAMERLRREYRLGNGRAR